jgi:hypothetical protein
MMTPWWELGEEMPPGRKNLPQNFGEAVTWALDWLLLASFRERLQMIRMCNRECEQQLAEAREQTYRLVDVVIVAPDDFQKAERIIDYDEPASRRLIELGESAAERTFKKHFGVH